MECSSVSDLGAVDLWIPLVTAGTAQGCPSPCGAAKGWAESSHMPGSFGQGDLGRVGMRWVGMSVISLLPLCFYTGEAALLSTEQLWCKTALICCIYKLGLVVLEFLVWILSVGTLWSLLCISSLYQLMTVTGFVSRVPHGLMKWQMSKLEYKISCFLCDFPALPSIVCALYCFSVAGSCLGIDY